ncbi:glycoside hydrolase family 127 protein [Dysgonomonas macrotermitis]|uniref:Uncharacterized protein n=1 Tax=Dysgonomonas macrotermitis TaxID=1346286 RepID=A0A1M5FUF1_9BACT|nr:glycoside hydrolase family 127 protein [Dysgonomonas macrotermitis]SHF95123.1 hypothetical protein SAMN05444362_112119 [Dysgonomonas macrotermitis]
MKKYFYCLIILLLAYTAHSSAQIEQKVEVFNLEDVRLLDSSFRQAQDLDRRYMLELDANRLLAPFLREAGLPQKAESYTNWENTGLDGHIGGHYVSALSLMYASTNDSQIKDRLDYMISELKRCQDANGNGYIGGVPGGKVIWEEVSKGNIKAGGFDLNGKWVPLYNIHKTYAGLRDAYLYAHNEEAKEMLIKMTDWAIKLVSQLNEDQIQDMLRSEHGGLNETFADVAAITGDKKYLDLARKFSHQIILQPLIAHEDRLTGMHANTQIPKVLGYKRIADIDGNKSWDDASRFFWETVVENRSVAIGGNSVGEHFNPTNDFSRVIKSIEGPETCNTYNMLRLSKMLYQTSLDKKYIDYYEKALYNHILSTQHPTQGGFVYFTQMRPGHYRVYSQPQTSFWCCVGSGLENHAKYGEMIYAHTDNDLYINLFIPSILKWKEKNTEITQSNNFPDEASTSIIINPDEAINFNLKVRYPQWVQPNTLKVSVNGTPEALSPGKDGYITISRKWNKGDKVVVEMPMHLSTEQLPDKSNYYAFSYGPVILAAKTNADNMDGLFADDSRGGHIAKGPQVPLKDAPIIVGNPDQLTTQVKPVEGRPLTFKLNGLYSEKYKEGMELIPFFRLHDSRYIIYWPQATEAEALNIQKHIEAEEQERIILDRITIDKVVCGEQQPESDHFIKYQESTTGFTEDIHWREAKGWFSYQLKNENKIAKTLYLKYFNKDRACEFDIIINGQVLVSKSLDGKDGDKIITDRLIIPSVSTGLNPLEIKIIAKAGSKTAQIAEIRILSE